MSKELFELHFYKDENATVPEKTCNPTLVEFENTLKTLSKQVPNSQIWFEKIVKNSNPCLRYKLPSGELVCIAVKDNVSNEDLQEYIKNTTSTNTSKSFSTSKQNIQPKVKRGRGRPRLIKQNIQPKVKRGRGRPRTLSDEERARREELKKQARLRSGGKRGRPKGSKNKH